LLYCMLPFGLWIHRHNGFYPPYLSCFLLWPTRSPHAMNDPTETANILGSMRHSNETLSLKIKTFIRIAYFDQHLLMMAKI
jgi:hypothetical protein